MFRPSNTLADADDLGVIGCRWQSSSDGITWSNIAGPTSASLTLTQAQVGKKIRTQAGYADGFGKIFIAFSSAGNAASDAIKQAFGLGALISPTSGSVKNQTNNWLTPAVSVVSGKSGYNNFFGSVTALGNAVNALGIQDQAVSKAKIEYLNDARTLIATIATATKQGDDILGSGATNWSMAPSQMDQGGGLSSWINAYGKV